MKVCEVNTPLYLLITLHALHVRNHCLQLGSVRNHQRTLADVIITSPWTRSRNFSPSCHNSPREALSKHLGSPGSTDCTQRATIWIWVRSIHVRGLAHWLKQSHAGRNCFFPVSFWRLVPQRPWKAAEANSLWDIFFPQHYFAKE